MTRRRSDPTTSAQGEGRNNKNQADDQVIQRNILRQRIPGRVSSVLESGSAFIIPLVELPAPKGGAVKEFFAPRRSQLGDLYETRPVAFRWRDPGKNSDDGKKPEAMSVEPVTEDEAEQLIDAFVNLTSERLRQQLQQERRELEKEREKLAAEAEARAEAQVKPLRESLDAQARELERLARELKVRSDNLQATEATLENTRTAIERERETLVRLKSEIEPYRFAVPLTAQVLAVDSDGAEPPAALAERWLDMLVASGMSVPKHIANSFLTAALASAYTGSFILLNGPVGVGKTSLVDAAASFTGGRRTVIPVRPSWIDPSDLLGFFDPINNVYRPTQFTTRLRLLAGLDRLHLMCLDELNLAKVENYAADILSRLEYSRRRGVRTVKDDGTEAAGGITLYADDIGKEMLEEARVLNNLGDQIEQRQQARLDSIRRLVEQYPPSIEIPANVILLGTLNSDETTYDISPKMIDRSYVITFPPADLSPLPQGAPSEPLPVPVSWLRNSINQILPTQDDAAWSTVAEWGGHLSELGISLGHRARRDLAVFSAAAKLVGINDQEALGYFLFMKILPRISFFKGPSGSGSRQERCTKWISELTAKYGSAGFSHVLANLRDQCADASRPVVRYWASA